MDRQTNPTATLRRRRVLQVGAVATAGTLLASTGATAQEDEAPFVFEQNGECIPVEPLEGDEPVEELYDYTYPQDRYDGPSGSDGTSYSSEGTTHLQRDDTSILFLYDGPDGTSLVVVHGRFEDEENDDDASESDGDGADEDGVEDDDDDAGENDDTTDGGSEADDGNEQSALQETEASQSESDGVLIQLYDSIVPSLGIGQDEESDDDGAGASQPEDETGEESTQVADADSVRVVSFTIDGLPSEGEWVVRDDYYLEDGEQAESNNDRWDIEDDPHEIDWAYRGGRTDGGAFLGVDEGDEIEIEIDPAFNQEAGLAPDHEHVPIQQWEVLSGDLDDPDRHPIHMDQPVTLYADECPDAATEDDEDDE